MNYNGKSIRVNINNFKKMGVIIFSTVLILCMIWATSALASVQTATEITLRANFVPTVLQDARNGNYPYVTVKCVTVHPSEGEDTYTRIRVVVKGTDHATDLTETTVITEGYWYNIPFKNVYIGYASYNFYFTGNSSAAALATVQYDAN